MVKILSTSSNDNMFCNSEQYSDCSSLLMKADDPPLEDLDPAILSCGLPAIILSDIQPVPAPPIRYTIGQLLAMRKSSLCFRRPAAADDPKIGAFFVWKTVMSRKGKPSASGPERPNNKDKDAVAKDVAKDKLQERPVYQKQFGRENGFVGPRFRRNYDFSNRSHHAIVKSYRSDNDHGLQNTVIEEEPEWVSAGPTSRLDTIELHGFDEDVRASQSSLDKVAHTNTKKASGNKGPAEKHISFYDDLQHYEQVHPKRAGGGPSFASGRDHDAESMAASNTSSPPPARSTPMKHFTDFGNMTEDNTKQNAINVNNFEEFMKFDSFLGTDSAPGSTVPSGSRFSKWFRRGGGYPFNQSMLPSNYDNRRASSFNQDSPFNGGGYGNDRYQYDRGQQRFPSNNNNRGPPFNTYEQHQRSYPPADSNAAFRRLVDMIAQNRASNNLIAQQQFLMQLLSKNQQNEILRRMLMKEGASESVHDAANQHQHPLQRPQQPQSPSQPRIPTQRELQYHTQSIMQNALLRKKLQDQRKMLLEQNTQMAAMAAMAAATNNNNSNNNPKSELNPAVQQFVQSVAPNMQRSLSVLSQTATPTRQQQSSSFNQTSSFHQGSDMNNSTMFAGGSTQHDLSASLQQILQPQHHSQGQGQRPFGNNRRYEKRSVTWNQGV